MDKKKNEVQKCTLWFYSDVLVGKCRCFRAEPDGKLHLFPVLTSRWDPVLLDLILPESKTAHWSKCHRVALNSVGWGWMSIRLREESVYYPGLTGSGVWKTQTRTNNDICIDSVVVTDVYPGRRVRPTLEFLVDKYFALRLNGPMGCWQEDKWTACLDRSAAPGSQSCKQVDQGTAQNKEKMRSAESVTK